MSIIIVFSIILISCESDLKPPSLPAFVKGKITFIGGKDSWPDSSEALALRVGLFKSDDPESFFDAVLKGDVYFNFFSFPLFVDEYEYTIEVSDTPIELKYLVVALQYSDSLEHQKVLSVYTETENYEQPSSIYLTSGATFTNIDFIVDFDNLPKQPF